jgi:transketolase
VEKFQSFGWDSVEVPGHDPLELINVIAGRTGERPMMVVAKTTKGKGVSFMENVPMWHYRSPSPEEFQTAVAELDAARG